MFDLAVSPELSHDAILIVAWRPTKALRSFLAHAAPWGDGELICTGLFFAHEEGKKCLCPKHVYYIYMYTYRIYHLSFKPSELNIRGIGFILGNMKLLNLKT